MFVCTYIYICLCVLYMFISNSISNGNDGKVKTLQFGECSCLLQMSLLAQIASFIHAVCLGE